MEPDKEFHGADFVQMQAAVAKRPQLVICACVAPRSVQIHNVTEATIKRSCTTETKETHLSMGAIGCRLPHGIDAR